MVRPFAVSSQQSGVETVSAQCGIFFSGVFQSVVMTSKETRMNVRSIVWSVAVALVTTVLVTGAVHAAKKVSTGDAAPDFKGVGTDDKEHSLGDFKKAEAIVLVFTCNHCPVAVAYEDRLIALQKDYQSKGVQVIALCVNDRDGDRLPDMKKRSEEKGFNFPYIYDATQQSAREYGATCTPHVFVLCKDRKIAYMGAIDDSMKEAKVSKHYVRDALDALLAGKQPETTVTKQFGCSIKWSKK
jgi:peroxiredoxin